jgi:hypothetical protein
MGDALVEAAYELAAVLHNPPGARYFRRISRLSHPVSGDSSTRQAWATPMCGATLGVRWTSG